MFNKTDISISIIAIFILQKLSLKKKKTDPFAFPFINFSDEREREREREKIHSPSGSRKPVSRVRGEDAYHDSNEEDLLTNKIKFTRLCWKYMALKIILKHYISS
jgi:hypothetical protein